MTRPGLPGAAGTPAPKGGMPRGRCHERPGKGRGRGVEKLRDLEDHEPIKLEGLEVDVSG